MCELFLISFAFIFPSADEKLCHFPLCVIRTTIKFFKSPKLGWQSKIRRVWNEKETKTQNQSDSLCLWKNNLSICALFASQWYIFGPISYFLFHQCPMPIYIGFNLKFSSIFPLIARHRYYNWKLLSLYCQFCGMDFLRKMNDVLHAIFTSCA